MDGVEPLSCTPHLVGEGGVILIAEFPGGQDLKEYLHGTKVATGTAMFEGGSKGRAVRVASEEEGLSSASGG